MKVLKSHRDEYFTAWAVYDFGAVGYLSAKTRFDYVPLAEMQRGDVIRSDWQIERLLKKLNESISTAGMMNPIILLNINHWYWNEHRPQINPNISFLVHTGNTRYQYAVENDYTHISSIILGASVESNVWRYLIEEMNKPLDEKINVDRDTMRSSYVGDAL
jgi:hypothetical protein